MERTDRPWLPHPGTPTGLGPADLEVLSDFEVDLLAEFHMLTAGTADSGPWWPMAIRRMPPSTRLTLTTDIYKRAAWERREQMRVAADPVYFTRSYGHVQHPEGPPVPFELWPQQADVMRTFATELRTVVLKARQLGLTWLALHYGFWLLAFNPHTPKARVLVLSKHGGDASKLALRAKRINQLLPPYLRHTEDPDSRRSLTRLTLTDRGELTSLAGTPEAARGETATLVIFDEFGHVRNRNAAPTWTAAQPTLGSKGRAIVIFTGNGPAEAPGDGQAAAQMWQRARTGESGIAAIFLPSHTHPERDAQWHERKRAEFLSDDEFYAEYPETEEQALAASEGVRVYPLAGISAAERLGRQLDTEREAGTLAPPLGDVLLGAADWGELTHLLVLWPLEAGGLYVCAEVAPDLGQAEPAHCTRLFHAALEGVQSNGTERPWPPVKEIRFDAAGVQSQRTFAAVAQAEAHAGVPYRERWELSRSGRVRTLSVPFNAYKDLGKNYLKHLFDRAAAENTTRVIAISPRCPVLLRQLRTLEVLDDGSGRIRKGDDHGPDALIAGAAPLADVWYARR